MHRTRQSKARFFIKVLGILGCCLIEVVLNVQTTLAAPSKAGNQLSPSEPEEMGIKTAVPKSAPTASESSVKPQDSPLDPGRWDGFRGIKWGADVKTLIGFEAENAAMEQIGNYYRRDEKLSLGPIQLREILWRFYKGQLYHVVIEGENGTFSKLKEATKERYGRTFKDVSDKYRESYLWSGNDREGKKVTLEVSRDKETGRVSCYFTYVPLEEAENRNIEIRNVERERKAEEKKAVEKAQTKEDW